MLLKIIAQGAASAGVCSFIVPKSLPKNSYVFWLKLSVK